MAGHTVRALCMDAIQKEDGPVRKEGRIVPAGCRESPGHAEKKEKKKE